jgi:hypothetical protein
MGARRTPTIIVEALDFLLKPLGFGRKQLTWNRERNGFVDVLDVQIGKSSEPDAISFTLNVGLMAGDVYEACWGKAPPAWIQETDCTVRTRLGMLGSESRDLWWDGDASEVRSDVVRRVQADALSFLDSIRNLQDVEGALERTLARRPDRPLGQLYLAIVKASLQKTDEAAALLDDVAKIGAWRGRVAEVRERLGT